MDLVSGAKGAGRAPNGALPCSGSELNSDEQAACWKITYQPLSGRVPAGSAPRPITKREEKGKRVNHRYPCVEGGGGASIQKHNTKQP